MAAREDDFPQRIRQALALRAGYICSFENCGRLTAGPSDESPTSVAVVGMAAHIHAAAPGGRRYDSTMSSEQRKDIQNGIWLCNVHGTLIDRDESVYTADGLRQMKRHHEYQIAKRVSSGEPSASTLNSLVAVGPGIICVGELVADDGAFWELRVDHFVAGDVEALTDYTAQFPKIRRSDQFVLLNQLGDGRVLAAAPSWRKDRGGLVVRLAVEPRFRRIEARALGVDVKLGPDGDITPELSLVSGEDALEQRIGLVLWHQKGQDPFGRDFGTRMAEYFSLFGSTPWLPQLFKLEAIRMASIPRVDSLTGEEATPFQCVERVHALELLETAPVDDWMSVRVHLTVKGVGEWVRGVRLYVPRYPFATVPKAR